MPRKELSHATSSTRPADPPWGPWKAGAVSPGYTYSRYNAVYQVFVKKVFMDGDTTGPYRSLTVLSIKRNDREPVHDWRDLQRIKNELTSPEHEAVELYPAESRKIDTSNHYWLWVLPLGRGFPFGQQYREVLTPEMLAAHDLARARQRPFSDDDPWNEPVEKPMGPFTVVQAANGRNWDILDGRGKPIEGGFFERGHADAARDEWEAGTR